MNFPNILTVLRIFLIPVLVATLLIKFENREIWGVIIFLLASVTDWLDGYLARRWKQVTVIGQILDPVADKMLTSAVLIALVRLHAVEAWLAVILIGREFAVSGLRMIALSQKIVIPAGVLGKIKTFAEVPTFALLILGSAWLGEAGVLAGKIGLWVVLTLSVVSGFIYFSKFLPKLDLTHGGDANDET